MSGAQATGRAALSALPLLGARDLTAPLAWREGTAISGAQFLRSAARLAQRLPAAGRPVNLCQDRLHFALGLAAALMRGQTSLMPPNALPATLQQLPAGEPGSDGALYALTDEAGAEAPGLPAIVVRLDETAGAAEPPDAQAIDMPRIAADLAAACLLTSGSTGAPQPHAKCWGALSTNIGAGAAHLARMLERPTLAGLTLVATVPPQHMYGFESSVLLALLGGAAFDAGRPFYPADIAAALERVPSPRALITTPFHLKALLGAGVALPRVDLVLSATAPLSPQLAAAAEAAMGARLVEIYGCTEAGQVAARRTTAGQTWTTLGELRITRQGGAAQRDDGEGTFVVSGGHVLEPTPLADVLVLHDEHHFQLLGRANDLIHVAGKRSSLAHLNFHLNRIEGVDDGAFWLPEPGELGGADAVPRPVAFVVAPRLTAAAIIAALRRELEPAFVPRRVVFVDALPREATGKLTVAALGRFARLQLGAAAPARADEPMAQAPQPEPSQGRSGDDHAGDDVYAVVADHPAFAGHFPGRPLLPGVMLLSLVMQSLARHPSLAATLGEAPTIDQVKFLSPVGPGSQVRVRLEPVGRGANFECRAAGRVVARGRLGPAANEASA